MLSPGEMSISCVVCGALPSSECFLDDDRDDDSFGGGSFSSRLPLQCRLPVAPPSRELSLLLLLLLPRELECLSCPRIRFETFRHRKIGWFSRELDLRFGII